MTSATTAAAPAKTSAPVDPIFRQIRDLVYKVCGIFQLEEKLYLMADACARRMKELVEEKSKQVVKRLRVWSAGCSTGEESYTLAMAMLEESDRLLKGWTVEILATDLNDRSVDTAKAGIYGDYALRSTSDYFKRKYFSQLDEKKLEIRPEVKKLITFSRLNLQDDSRMLLMKGMDLIFCCNVLIYLDGPSKAKVVNHYYSNLNFGGYFFLGTSESLLNLNDKFHLVHFPGTIAYWKPSLKSGKL
jgi:chemotaxis protein methyltransferase CheR